ncbi:Nonribosomal peptide synthetase 8 [Talaromyces islandicus]|uniref:Nonribosomal peptide synthetase 8 n=1 Tax=Talaromyces islandicus TaxID=28573 RepID=A0A0U1M201_TALIS|nr:Nonribosomal peptide synthetase 8 [Talaromyces islandicus]
MGSLVTETVFHGLDWDDWQKIQRWNQSPPQRLEVCLHDLIKERAQIQPQETAICAWDGQLTYSELVVAISSLTSWLRAHGVRRGSRIPLCMEKSKHAVITMFAIMQAGAAWVPLDISHPIDRLRAVIEQIGSSLIAVSEKTSSIFADEEGLQPLVISSSLFKNLKETGTRPISVSSEDTAFVMFTSGSTGKPSGVIISHSAMASAAASYSTHLRIDIHSRVMQFAAFIWLPCTVEIIATLIAGGRVCIPSEHERLNNPAKFMRDHKVTTAVLAPSFLGALSPDAVPTLQVLGLGGEKIPQNIVDEWAASLNLVLCYGSTETNLCILETIRNGSYSHTNGKPSGARAWIASLEDINHLAPIGTIGELLIESWTLADGYLNEVTKTEKKFVPSPDWLKSGKFSGVGRFCRVGDLARYNPDGTIQVLGRKEETTVKIRGQKVELSEVESHVQKWLPAGMKVAVIPVTFLEDGSVKLVAFVSLGIDGSRLTGRDLVVRSDHDRQTFSNKITGIELALARTVPSYMIPSVFIPLYNLPLTISGKLDHRELSKLVDGPSIELLGEFTSRYQPGKLATNSREKLICSLWSSVLKIPQPMISLDDHFFRLGGDSVKAIKLVSLCREQSIQLEFQSVFEHPTLKDMANAIVPSDGPGMRDSLDAYSLLHHTADPYQLRQEISSDYGIEESHIQDIYPATTLQSGLLALSMKQPGAYTVRTSLSLSGIDTERIRRAWNNVTARHQILRTRIVQTSAGLMQVVLEQNLDWSAANNLTDYLERDRNVRMHLGSPLSRVAIIDNPPLLVWTAHHALLDAWSMSQTFHQLELAYDDVDLPQNPSYNTFIQYLNTIDSKSQESFWYSQLDGAAPTTWPPLPSPDYQMETESSIRQTISIPEPTSKLKDGKITPACILRTAWAILLSKYTDTEDVIFHSTVSGRAAPVAGINDIIGPTIATVPVRIHWESNQPILKLLEDVQNQSTAMIPFEQVGIQNIRRLSTEIQHACNCQTLFVVQTSTEGSALNFLDQKVTVEDWQNFAAYPIVVECMLSPGSALCHITYDPKVLEQFQVEAVIFQLEHIVQQLSSREPDTPIEEISAFSPHDNLHLRNWNKALPQRVDSCTHHEFAKRVSLHPDRISIDAWDGKLTYRELDTLATRLAHHLQNFASIGPEDIIPVIFPKSKWSVVSMLGLWKAGGAFALIDAGHPANWILTIVRGTGARIVLCSEHEIPFIEPEFKGLIINDNFLSSLPESQEPVQSCVEPANVAYVVHSSGSTGTPKGIVHTHSTYLSGVFNRIPTMFRDHTARVLQFASYSFDVSIEDTWTTLLVGGTVCIPSDYERVNDLTGFMNRAKVTYAEITPSLSQTLNPESLPYLKIIALSGEASTKADRDRWLDHAIVLDEYGPAEIAIKSNLKKVGWDSHPSDKGPQVACLGWITEPRNHDKLQAIGAIGELLLEGPIVSRGYLNQPQKTDEVFIKNPAWLPIEYYGSRRLYKTGDLASYNPDGSIRILGRRDAQTKVRGQRLELGHIEYVIKQNLSIPAKVVVELASIKEWSQKASLIVFLSLTSIGNDRNTKKDLLSVVDQLYTNLSITLPSYMIPTALVPMNSLPLNMSGKVDRLKLKAYAMTLSSNDVIHFSGTQAVSQKRAPSSEAEKWLQSIWASVLEINNEVVSAEDNFLHLGGDSILAMKMVAIASRMKSKFSLTVARIFQHPRLSDMALAICKVEKVAVADSGHKMQPFELLPNSKRSDIISGAADACNITIHDVEDIYPCTPLQAGIMAISIARPSYYIAHHVFLLPPDANLEKLQHAWETVSRRMPILRTRFVQLGSDLLQVVVRKHGTEWLSGDSLKTYMSSDLKVPMALGQPLNRFGIVRESNRTYLALTLHHAVYDGYSIQVILNAVAKLYKFGVDAWHPVTEFRHFIQYLTCLDRDAHAEFWRNKLKGAAESSLTFPRLTRPLYKSNPQSTMELELSIPITATKGITTPSLLHGAWALLTARYMENNDLIVGMTVNGRNAPLRNIDQNPGPTFTTVPVRTCLQWNSTVAEFLEQVQNDAIAMIPYQHFGLQNISGLNEDGKHACAFRTLLVIQSKEESESSINVIGQREVFQDYTRFNLYAIMIQFMPISSSRILVNVSYDENIVDHMQMQKLLKNLQQVIAALSSANPTSSIGDIQILSREDKAQIREWNNTETPLAPKMATIHEVFRQQVSQEPNALAVNSWDGDLTYQELDGISSQFAIHLQSLGIKPGDIVPLCFEKSKWAVISVFAVLKAGGAFVLLDPSHPLARLRGIVLDTKARVVLSSPASACYFAKHVDHVIVASNFKDMSLCQACVGKSSPNDLACLVFTSGSTGKPKGIMLSHSAICSSIAAHGPALNVNRNSRVFQFASYAFDMAVYDICTTLLRGGCVCIPSEHEKMNKLTKVINDMKINWAFFTPSTLSLLTPAEVPTLKTLVVGGEAVTQDICETWIDQVRLIQCSGPAETTTCIAAEMSRKSKKNCLGKGLGVRCWIVDPSDYNTLCPIGVVGELVIEGPTVANGYLDPSADTTNAFIETLPKWATETFLNGSVDNEGRRMYKTGDMVQYNSDGNLLFIGRKDHQQKIRGQRVEISEIEDCLHRSFRGMNLVVDMIKPTWDTRRSVLGAFVASETSKSDTAEDKVTAAVLESGNITFDDIQNALTDSLPQYMIPSVVVPLNHIPLNSSGKVDRRQIRQLGAHLTPEKLASFSVSTGCKEMPKGDMEQNIASLWGTVLGIGVSSIGRDDSFIRLGGDSLCAMHLASAARKQGIALTVLQIFQSTNLADMASVATEITGYDKPCTPFELLGDTPDVNRIRATCASLLAVDENSIDDIYPCTSLQEGLMALSAQRHGAYTTQEVFELRPDIDIQKFKGACEMVYAATAILRTRIVQLETSQMMQVVMNEELLWHEHDSIDEYLNEDKNRPIRMSDPLVRWALVGPGRRSFVWTMHHCSYDGHSLVLTLQAIEDAYLKKAQITLGLHQYNNFIRALVKAPQDSQRQYWKNKLDGASRCGFPHILNRNRPVRPDSTCSLHVSPLFPNSTSFTVGLPTIIRAAWALVLAQYTHSSDIVFGMTVSGRNTPVSGIDDIIGPTFTTVPVRVGIDYAMSLEAFLKQVQREAFEMTPHEQYGLHRIKKLAPEAFSACSFENLLVIQPPSILSTKGNSVFQLKRSATHSTFRTYALTMICQLNNEGGVSLTANFDERSLGHRQVQRLLAHFSSVIQQILSSSADLLLGKISMLTIADEREIWSWNDKVPSTENTCVHHVIQERMKETPDSVAISSWDGTLTYSELDEICARLADSLVAANVGNGHRIPILFEKSKWAVVAVLGILRSGAAFVPMDPSHPKLRLNDMVQRIKPPLVLTSADYHGLGVELATHAFEVSEMSIQCLTHTGRWKNVPPDPHSPVYVNFTSGTSGTPKASVIEHRNYCSGAASHIPKIQINKKSRVLQFASYAFDTCIEDILTTLMVGACICIPSDQQRESDIAGAIHKHGVNWAHLTPSYARSIDPENVPSLEVLLLGGEAMTSYDVDKWKDHVNIINVYGPSELCVTCSVNPDVALSVEPANIGHAVGCVTWVVEPEDVEKLVPIGSIGELLVEGPLMARGYLNDPVLTSQKFIDAPSWLVSGGRSGRLYKTGDLVRYHWDGSLVYIGRKDGQRKLHGQRIELEDIEQNVQRLSTDFSGMIAAEIIHPADSDSPVLALFIGGTSDEATEGIIGQEDLDFQKYVEKIRQHLPELLPLHMVPSIFIPVTTMPFTPSRKVDRLALRKAAAKRTFTDLHSFAGGQQNLRQPEGSLQRKLQSIWMHVLNKPAEAIAANVPFMAIGGDSISAMQVLAGCRKNHLPVKLQDIMVNSTIEQIAAFIEEKFRDGFSMPTHVETSSEELHDNFPLSPIQRRFFSLYPDGNTKYQLNRLVRINQPVSELQLQSALFAVSSANEMLRARFQREKGQWKQKINSDVSGSFAIRSHSGKADLLDQLKVIRTCENIINIHTGPIIVADLIESSSGQFVLFSVHHLVFDLVSWRIFLEDLTDKILQPERPAATEQNTMTKGNSLVQPFEVTTADCAYWGKNALSSPYHNLTFAIEQGVSKRILKHGTSRTWVNMVDIFLAPLLHSFKQTFPDRDPPAVFNSSHGRNTPEPSIDLSRTIGWFTLFYPIAAPEIDAQQPIWNTVQQVAQIRREAAEHGWQSFATRYLRSGDSCSSNNKAHPIMGEIAFNYQGQFQQLERPDALFSTVSEEVNLMEQPIGSVDTRHDAVVEVVLGFREDQLFGSFSYSGMNQKEHKIKEWMNVFCQLLKELASWSGDDLR